MSHAMEVKSTLQGTYGPSMHVISDKWLSRYDLMKTCIYKNSAEVDIAPAFGEITTACNVGQAKKGHGACLKSGQLVYARFHTHSHRCCREMYFNSRHKTSRRRAIIVTQYLTF